MQHTNIASLIQKILNKKTKKTEEFLRPLLLRCSRSKIDQFLLLRCQKRRSIPIVILKMTLSDVLKILYIYNIQYDPNDVTKDRFK